MSLQVWLPLNGNLNNQGLSGVTFTNEGTVSVDTSGKIGSCYSRATKQTSGRIISNSKVLFDKSLSICCWAYVSDCVGDTANGLVTIHSHEHNSNVGITVKQYSSTDYRISCNTGIGNDRTYCTYYGSTNIKNTWSHLSLTYDKASKVLKLYVNGNCEYTLNNYTNYAISDNIILFDWSTTYNNPAYRPACKLNDVRIYDHCLSAKEVKEISEGLLCHYKLDNNGFGNPNLFSNSHFDSRYTVSDWDTSKNGNLCANGWGGYNGGVGNPSTVYHAHLQEHEGGYVYNYHKTSNEEWLGISQYITGSVEVSKTYTFSCELKRISGKNYADGGLYTRANSSATSNTFVNWFSFSNFGSVTDNKWHRYSYTFTVDSSVYMTNGAYWYIYGHTGGDGEFLMRRPKLEEGSSATEWIPCTSDNLYTSLGLNSTTEVDCSGLSNNGTKIGGLSSSTNPLSIRYESCYNFDGNTGSIQIPNLATLVPSGEFTMNCWIYHDDIWSSKGYETILGGPSGFELEAKPASTNSPSLYAYSWGQGQATYELNKWNMITMTRNASETKFYINGELKITGSAGTIPSGNYFIGAWNTSSQQNYKGRISDFRLYSTVLSVEDIKELYNISASIDKNGNMYAYEFKED